MDLLRKPEQRLVPSVPLRLSPGWLRGGWRVHTCVVCTEWRSYWGRETGKGGSIKVVVFGFGRAR